MAYTTINKSTAHFNTITWTGTGSSNALTGVGFQPDFVWIKKRNGSTNHALFDALRGTGIYLESSSTAPDQTDNTSLSAFGTDGFTVVSKNSVNTNGDTYVGWNWKGANSSGTSNSNGSITSTVSANATAGFSIVKYVGNATSGATVGHGLSVAPKFIIIKSRDTNGLSWRSYHASLGAGKYIELDANATAVTASNFMNDTAPTSTVFSLGNGTTPNKSGDNYIAYCFAEKTGHSKFGSFTGNGNADGTFIYTGFKPSWIMFKRTSAASDWTIFDTKRLTYNVNNLRLEANTTDAEPSGAANKIDILSNGFKMRHSSSSFNNSGGTYIYMAFGQSLVGSNNIPCTAR
jgi:hypothetical protein